MTCVRSLVLWLVLLLSVCLPGHADQSVTLGWDASPDPEVTGIVCYYGNASRNYPYHTNWENGIRGTVTGLQSGLTYYFAITATNSAGLESDYSNEVSTFIPTLVVSNSPSPPAKLRIICHTHDPSS